MKTLAILLNQPVTFRRFFYAEPLFAAAGIFLALSLFITLPAMLMDTRTLQGENIWIKPIKFQVSLIVYTLTLAFFAQWLPKGMTSSLQYRIFSITAILCIAAEMLWIAGAAMYGVASHFNTEQPFLVMIYPLMGIVATLLTFVSFVYGIAIWRNKESRLEPALQLSLALGLVLTFAITIPVASQLAGQPGHFVGTPELGESLALMGWSREVGDLRVAHFFSLHAMHFIPLAGWLIVRYLPKNKAVISVWGMVMFYVLLTGFTFVQALMGKPLIPLS